MGSSMARHHYLPLALSRNLDVSLDLIKEDVFEGKEIELHEYDGHTTREFETKSTVWQSSFTFIARINPNLSGVSKILPIFECRLQGSPKGCFVGLIDGRPIFILGKGKPVCACTAVPDGEWSWLTCVFDAKAGKRILMNGVEVKRSSDCQTFEGRLNISIGSNLHVPHKAGLPHKIAPSYFEGRLEGLMLLQRALSNSEVHETLEKIDADFQVSLSTRFSTALDETARFCKKKTIFSFFGESRVRRWSTLYLRMSQLADVVTDSLLVIDNATASDWHITRYFGFDESLDLWWALIGLIIMLIPFVAEFVILHDIGVKSLSGWPCPCVMYNLLGFPFVLLLKFWYIIVSPLSDLSETNLTFLGAYREIDLVLEGIEALLQAAFSIYMYIRKVMLGRARLGRVPCMLLLSILSSVLIAFEALRLLWERPELQLVHLSSRWNADKKQHKIGRDGVSSAMSNWDMFKSILANGVGTRFALLPGKDIKIGTLSEIVWALTEPSTLNTLDLPDAKLKRADHIAAALKANRHLVSLGLSGNHIENIEALSSSLEENDTLTSLDLSRNAISNIENASISLSKNRALTFINMSANPLESTAAFETILKAHQTLQHLILTQSQIEDINGLALGLQGNGALEVLHLNHNCIQDVNPLAKALPSCKLKRLVLANNYIVDIAKLSKALEANTFLEILDLRGNCVRDATCLQNAMEANRTLKCVDLMANPVASRRVDGPDERLSMPDQQTGV